MFMFMLVDMTGGCHYGFCQAAALCPLRVLHTFTSAFVHRSNYLCLLSPAASLVAEHSQTHYSLCEFIFVSHMGLVLNPIMMWFVALKQS